MWRRACHSSEKVRVVWPCRFWQIHSVERHVAWKCHGAFTAPLMTTTCGLHQPFLSLMPHRYTQCWHTHIKHTLKEILYRSQSQLQCVLVSSAESPVCGGCWPGGTDSCTYFSLISNRTTFYRHEDRESVSLPASVLCGGSPRQAELMPNELMNLMHNQLFTTITRLKHAIFWFFAPCISILHSVARSLEILTFLWADSKHIPNVQYMRTKYLKRDHFYGNLQNIYHWLTLKHSSKNAVFSCFSVLSQASCRYCTKNPKPQRTKKRRLNQNYTAKQDWKD